MYFYVLDMWNGAHESILNSAAHLVYSARRSEHNSIASRAPLAKSSRADEISAVLTAAFMGWRRLISLGAFIWRLTLTFASACILLTHPHRSYYTLITQRSAIWPSQWLRLLHGTAFRLPSEMHRRWCRSATAWRLFCSDRPLVTSLATVSVFMFVIIVQCPCNVSTW